MGENQEDTSERGNKTKRMRVCLCPANCVLRCKPFTALSVGTIISGISDMSSKRGREH